MFVQRVHIVVDAVVSEMTPRHRHRRSVCDGPACPVRAVVGVRTGRTTDIFCFRRNAGLTGFGRVPFICRKLFDGLEDALRER
jgi:hypothetical protein